MLISSSFLSTAPWQNEPLPNFADLATQNPPNDTPKPAVRPAQPGTAGHQLNTGGAKPHGNAEPANGRQREQSEVERRAEAHRMQQRRAHRKIAKHAEKADAAATGQPASAENPDASSAQAQFATVLNEALPRDWQTVQGPVGQDPRSGMLDPRTEPGIPSNGLIPPSASSFTPPLNNDRTSMAESSADLNVVKPGAAPGTAESPEIAMESKFDKANIEIRAEALAADPRTGMSLRTTARGEVAFTARIQEQSVATALLAAKDLRTAIAASRFETSPASHPNAGGPGATALRLASNSHSNQPSIAEDPGSPGQSQYDSQASPDSQEQDTRRTNSPNSQTSAERGSSQPEVTAALSEMHSSAVSQSAIPAVGGAAASSSLDADTRGPGAAKSGSNPTPQPAEPESETTESTRESVREIALQLSSKDQGNVQVRLSERAGELHVSVRTPDTGLTRGLRDGLTDLVGRLEQQGYRADVGQPSGHSASQDQGRDAHSQGNASQQKDTGSGGGRQQNPQQQQQNPRAPQWVGEIESSLQRSNTTWPPSAAR